MTITKSVSKILVASGLTLAISASFAAPVQLQVSITNNSPAGGVAITPVWVGFHNGSFDSYDGGSPAASALESLAELGMTGPISDVFAGTLIGDPVDGRVQDAIQDSAGGPIFAGGSNTVQFMVDDGGANQYFSYAAMVLPSNDFFIANGNPLAHDLSGLFSGAVSSITFDVGNVNDAGTEVNDFAFSPNPPPFGIPGGDAPGGAAEGGVITNVADADPFAAFLNQPAGVDITALNFNDAGLYPNGIATITLSVVPAPVPVPAALPLAASAFGALFAFMRRRKPVA